MSSGLAGRNPYFALESFLPEGTTQSRKLAGGKAAKEGGGWAKNPPGGCVPEPGPSPLQG